MRMGQWGNAAMGQCGNANWGMCEWGYAAMSIVACVRMT